MDNLYCRRRMGSKSSSGSKIYIKKYIGVTGQNIVTKLMGLIVGALAVQFIISGVVHLAKGYF